MRDHVLNLEEALHRALRVEPAPSELRQDLLAAAKSREVDCGMAKKARFACLFGGGQGGLRTRNPGFSGDFGATQRVQAVPPERVQGKDRRHWMSMSLAIAATVLLAFFFGATFWRGYLSDPAPALAHQAFVEYTGAQNMAFKGRPMANCQCGDGCACCAQWSQQALGFAAPLPVGVSCQCLQGGRGCKVGDRPAALYLLDEQRAVYVFREPIRNQLSSPGKAIPLPQSLQARLWNEGGRGYLMLEAQAKR